MKKCSSCKEVKNTNLFYKNTKQKDKLNSYCKNCNKLWVRNRYLKNKGYYNNKNKEVTKRNQLFVIAFLKQNPCVDCKENDIVVLDFDHLGNKSGNISSMVSNRCSIETIKKEIEKCVVRCANCHRRKTAQEGNFYKIGK